LLSAYELSDRQYPALLQKAEQLADKMAFAWVGVRILFDSPQIQRLTPMPLKENAVPFGHINFATNEPAKRTVCYQIYRCMLLKLMVSTPIDKHSRSRYSGYFFVQRYSFTTILILLKLTLEWATLSKYTGNDTYRALAEKSARQIAKNPAPLPGLPAQGIDPGTGKPVGGYVVSRVLLILQPAAEIFS
jgi:mannosyl-oligosaccharide alpha-1,2-mannosidase